MWAALSGEYSWQVPESSREAYIQATRLISSSAAGFSRAEVSPSFSPM